jgi:PhnB protein
VRRDYGSTEARATGTVTERNIPPPHPEDYSGPDEATAAAARPLDEEMAVPTRLNPYISFETEAREAMQFYQSVFGGELTMSTFAEFEMAEDASEAEKVMHAQLDTPNGLTLMGADTPNAMPFESGSRITISLSGDDETQLRGYWDRLVEGGRVTLPLEQAPWGDSFGMCTDRYGVNWMLNIAGSAESTSAN